MLVCEADGAGLGVEVLLALLAYVCGGVCRVAGGGESGSPRADAGGSSHSPLYT